MSLEHWPYLGIFLVLLSAGLGLPLPEDIPLLTAGYLCHGGYARLEPMIAIAAIGVLTGDIILFTVGRLFGHHVVERPFTKRFVHPSRLVMAERMFAKHGIKIIFAGRFMPGLRPMIFMAAGVLKVRPLTFIIVDGLAAAISVPTLIVLGKIFGDNLGYIEGKVREFTHVTVVAAAVGVLIALAIYWHRRQSKLVEKADLKNLDAQTLAHMPPATELRDQQDPKAKPQ